MKSKRSDAREESGDRDRDRVEVGRKPLRYARATRLILALASALHGVVTRRQLLDAGISPQIIKRRIRSGLLRPLHGGVYLIEGSETPRSKAVAAILACGERSALCRRGAAGVRGWIRHDFSDAPIDVAVPKGDRRRPGIRVRRISDLAPDEVTVLDGIRITTPARTLLDLAAEVSTHELERVLVGAFADRATTPAEIAKLLDRHSRHSGAAKLRAVLANGDAAHVRSEAEARFVRLIRDARLPDPETNVRIGDVEVDCLWREHRLIVEVDGRAYHSTAERFEADRRRDRALVAQGFRVIRVTVRQLREESIALAAQLAAVVGTR